MCSYLHSRVGRRPLALAQHVRARAELVCARDRGRHAGAICAQLRQQVLCETKRQMPFLVEVSFSFVPSLSWQAIGLS